MVIDCIFHDLIAAKLYLHSLFFPTLNLHKYLQNMDQNVKTVVRQDFVNDPSM